MAHDHDHDHDHAHHDHDHAPAELGDDVQVEVAETGPVVRTLTITVAAERVAKAFDRAYRDLSKTARIKGFRPGKVPRGVLERMYGATVPDEIQRALVSETLHGAIVKADVMPLSEPDVDSDPPSEGEAFEYSVRIEVKPEITLPELDGLACERPLVVVAEEEIDAELDRLRDQFAPLVEVAEDVAIETGHQVTLDFEGRVDGELFEGGKGEGMELEIGSGRLIPGFEDQLIGAKAGEARDVEVTFPEDYGEATLAGKDAVFACQIQAVKGKQLPALDDEFAKDTGEFETLEELKNRIRDDLTKQRDSASEQTLHRTLMDTLLERVDFPVPPGVVERQLRSQMESTHRQFQGRVPDDVLRQQLMRMQEEGRPNAERRVREAFVLEAVATANDLSVDDEAKQARMVELAEAQGVEVEKFAEMAEQQGWGQAIEAELMDKRVYDFLVERADISEVSPEPETSPAESLEE